MRLEPFAALHVELQGGKFDYPDRLFSSVLFYSPSPFMQIEQTWESCLKSISCFKELIPEFFYMPEFLENVNQYKFGKTQSGQDISVVALPPYVSSCPFSIVPVGPIVLKTLFGSIAWPWRANMFLKI